MPGSLPWLIALAVVAQTAAQTPAPAPPGKNPAPTPPGKTPAPAPPGRDVRPLADAEAQARAGHVESAVTALEQVLSYGAARAADALVNPAFLPLHTDPSFRRVIRIHAEASATLVVPEEPGTPLDVTGVVRNPEGEPVLGALLYVYHADAAGHYTADQGGAMDEPHARLFAYLRTGPDGRYQFRTVRPGGYPGAIPIDGEPRLIPAHIHFEVSAPDLKSRRFQLVFSDDPRLDAHWRTWARENEYPIARVDKVEGGIAHADLDITLAR